MTRSRSRRTALQTAAALALAALPMAAHALPREAAVSAVRSNHTLKLLGTSRLSAPPQAAINDLFSDNSRSLTGNALFRTTPTHALPTRAQTALRALRMALPRPAASPVAEASRLFGFDGLTNTDQVYAGTGIYANSQYTLEPPDQALAVGNGYVLEAVNNALVVYKTDGTLASGPVTINQFFQQAPEFNRNGNGTYGESFSDPRAYYDSATKRWFVEEWGLAVDPYSGATLPSSTIFLAVSKTADPTGDYLIYAIPTTYTGKSTDPILPDYTMIGTDANGVYLSTNTYSLTTGHFAGVNLYAIPKLALEATMTPATAPGYAEFDTVDPSDAFTLDPAITPPGAAFNARKDGTEFFMSIGFDGQSLNVYALTHTKSLADSTIAPLRLVKVKVASEAFPSPPPAEQKDGPRPLGASVKEPVSTLESGGFRILNATYANNKLYGAQDVAVLDVNGNARAGLAYSVVNTRFDAKSNFAPTLASQGYIGVTGEDLIMPSLTVNKSGGELLVCTLTGPDYFPSAAYVTFASGNPTVHLAKGGTNPADGFTGYKAFGGGGTERWGDYSSAVSDESGNIWMGVEYIPNKTRTTYANWGTYLFKVTP